MFKAGDKVVIKKDCPLQAIRGKDGRIRGEVTSDTKGLTSYFEVYVYMGGGVHVPYEIISEWMDYPPVLTNTDFLEIELIEMNSLLDWLGGEDV